MLDEEQIRQQFCLFTGLEAEDLAPYASVLKGGQGQLVGLLRADIDLDQHMERLSTVAAALAYGDYLMLTQSSFLQGDEIKVGDISLKALQGQTPPVTAAGKSEIIF